MLEAVGRVAHRNGSV